MPKHFMRIRDLGHSGAWEIIRRAKEMKETNYRGHCMDGKVAALIFEKASTRTRVSFDVAVRQLGGTTIFMTPAESQLGRSEPLRDTARVLSRYVDCLIVRTFGQEKLDELAEYGSLPVVNALTDQGHPCQLMADLLTIYERTPDFSKVTVTWVGDGNNMANSWIEAAMYFPFQLNMAIAPGYEPDQQLLALALQSGAKIFLTHDPKLAVDGANYIYADVWASMGQEEEQKKREEAFKGFCVDSELMSLAAPGVKFLHCLPAHRGEEVTDEVMALLSRGATVDRIRLREYAIHPCIGCGYCSAHPGHCVFDGDDVADLFRRMEHADSLILNIPVYFYGPPALLKGFIDRAQIFWEQRREGTRTPRRPAHAVLCAARTRGDRLFEANLLILRCFLDTLGFSLHEPLLLRGVERPTDLLHSQAIAQIERFGLEAAEQATRFYHE